MFLQPRSLAPAATTALFDGVEAVGYIAVELAAAGVVTVTGPDGTVLDLIDCPTGALIQSISYDLPVMVGGTPGQSAASKRLTLTATQNISRAVVHIVPGSSTVLHTTSTNKTVAT